MIRYTLEKPIHRMEGVAGKRGRHNPFMMRFVQRFIHQRMMQPPVDPIDEEVGEADEEWNLEEVVKREGRIGWAIVDL